MPKKNENFKENYSIDTLDMKWQCTSRCSCTYIPNCVSSFIQWNMSPSWSDIRD